MFTGQEILSDVPDLFDIGQAAQERFAAQPKTAIDWANALGLKQGGVGYSLCATFDTVKAATGTAAGVTLDQVIQILGVDPAGVLGKTIALGQKIAQQAKD
jgi:hypothetical protein